MAETEEDTFTLIDFLDLNYLSYINDIKLNSLIPSIIELYAIKVMPNYEHKYTKLISYFRDKFNESIQVSIESVCCHGYVNILDYIYTYRKCIELVILGRNIKLISQLY